MLSSSNRATTLERWLGERRFYSRLLFRRFDGIVFPVELTPVIREKPFLFIGDDGKYKVFRPALRYNSKGISWMENDRGEGMVYDLENDFYVVKPVTTAATMNAQLAAGKHLFVTQGRYEMSEPLHITHPDAIVLGVGYATLIPSGGNNESVILIDDVDGVTIAGLLLEAHGSTKNPAGSR